MRRMRPACGYRKVSVAAAVLMAANLLAPGALAQRLSFGVVAGGYANSDFDSEYIPHPGFPPSIRESGSGGYVIGPSLDVRVFPKLSLGVEAFVQAAALSGRCDVLERRTYRLRSGHCGDVPVSGPGKV